MQVYHEAKCMTSLHYCYEKKYNTILEDDSVKNPIGVFDTGVGGLSCVGPIIEKMPDESIIFFGDCLRAPYGDRPAKEIKKFSVEMAAYLVSRGCKALVIACNTISCTALNDIQQAFPSVPVIGIIDPAARAIAKLHLDEVIVISTEATAKSGAYANAVGKLCHAKVIAKGCPKFVPIIEGGKTGSKEAEDAVHSHMDDIVKEDSTVVTGCTHYPFIASDIQRVYPSVRILNPAEALAEEVFDILKEKGLLSDGPAEYEFSASLMTETFKKLADSVMGEKEYSLTEHIL